MDKNEQLKYWKSVYEKDLNSLDSMFEAKQYHWALFIGHLSLEKLLKYVLVSQDKRVPMIHDITKLASLADIELPEDLVTEFEEINSFNINARYPDYKEDFYNRATKEYTQKWISKIKSISAWIKEQI